MITLHTNQTPADVAVVIPTILRPSLLRAVRSVFAQELNGRIHLLIGVDAHKGDAGLLEQIKAECPAHVMLTILDPGYSTSQRHGGFYSNHYGGALRTILSYAANSRYVAYLDDNDWYSRSHLAGLLRVIAGKNWAFSYRWLVEPRTERPICRDEWDSVGPGRGINQARFGGFVQPSGLMMDKEACHLVMPLWSLAAFSNGTGEDRLIFKALNENHTWACSQDYSSYCILAPENITDAHHLTEFHARGIRWIADDALFQRLATLEAAAAQSCKAENWPALMKQCAEILQINPYHADALYQSAQGEQAQGRLAEALAHIEKAIIVDDSRPDYFALQAQLLSQFAS